MAITFGTVIHFPLRMNFDDPLPFHLVPPADQNFSLSNAEVYNHIPEKLIMILSFL